MTASISSGLTRNPPGRAGMRARTPAHSLRAASLGPTAPAIAQGLAMWAGRLATALPMGALAALQASGRSQPGALDAVSIATGHPASALRCRRDGQQRRPQSENLLKTLGSNCIQEGEPTCIRSPIDHQIEGRT